MSARHEHTFRIFLDIITAHSAAGWFEFCALLLTMLVFYEYYRKSIDCFLTSSLCLLSLLCFLLADSSDHLEKIVRRKVLIIVVHEVVWIEVTVLCLHPYKVPTIEHIHEVAQYIID